MKTLIIEDERKTAAYLKRGLEENGFIADIAGTTVRMVRISRKRGPMM